MSVRLRKIARDLFHERARAVLVLLALIVGGWGVGSVIASTTVIEREIRDNYLATIPPHTTLSVRGDGDLAALAKSARWVTQAEERTVVAARARGGFDGRLPVVLTIVDDFAHQRIALVELERGRWPEPGEVVLERDDLTVLGLREPPDWLALQVPGESWRQVPVAGVVHDPGKAPARMEHCLYVYGPRGTAEMLGASLESRDVIVRMAAPAVTSLRLARGHAALLGDFLRERGFEVERVAVPVPERHPHHGQMASMQFLQAVFGGLALLLSCVVVANTMSSLMRRHVAQIGVLKAVGGSPSQIAGMYLTLVLALAVGALLVTAPFGFGSGLRHARAVVEQLNFDQLTAGAPLHAWLWFIGLSVALPVASAAPPIVRAARTTVRDAIAERDAPAAWRLTATPRLPIAMRNVLRRPARTTATVVSLAVGLAALASAFHVGASLRKTMEVATATRPYDVAFAIDPSAEARVVADALAKVGDPVRSWKGSSGGTIELVSDDGSSTDAFPVLVADPLDRPPATVVDGEWRLPPEGRAIALSSRLAAAKGLRAGDVVDLRIDGETSRWPVGAVLRQIGSGGAYLLSREPLGFAGVRSAAVVLRPPTASDLERTTGTPFRGHGHGSRAPALAKAVASYQADAVRRIEDELEAAGVAVRVGTTKAEIIAGLEDHVHVMTEIVALASLVVIAIAGLGLASAMSVSVLERTREIGVLRALGATPSRLATIFAAETATVGGLGLAGGVAASLPLGRAIADHFGRMMFQTPLDPATSFAGAGWAAGVVALLVAVVTGAVLVQVLRRPVGHSLRHE